MVAPATGRGAQDGSGGFRSTGQIGPAVTVPTMLGGGPETVGGALGVTAALELAVGELHAAAIATRNPSTIHET